MRQVAVRWTTHSLTCGECFRAWRGFRGGHINKEQHVAQGRYVANDMAVLTWHSDRPRRGEAGEVAVVMWYVLRGR